MWINLKCKKCGVEYADIKDEAPSKQEADTNGQYLVICEECQ